MDAFGHVRILIDSFTKMKILKIFLILLLFFFFILLLFLIIDFFSHLSC